MLLVKVDAAVRVTTSFHWHSNESTPSQPIVYLLWMAEAGHNKFFATKHNVLQNYMFMLENALSC